MSNHLSMSVANTLENAAQCACVNCPSYTACMRASEEILYCAKEKSNCSVPSAGCVCGGCPVHLANHLNSGYYCLSGRA